MSDKRKTIQDSKVEAAKSKITIPRLPVASITLSQAKSVIEKYFKAKNRVFSSHQFIRKYKKDFESSYISQSFYFANPRVDVQARINVIYSFSYVNNVITKFLENNKNVMNIETIQGSFTEDYDDITGSNVLFRRTSSDPITIVDDPIKSPRPGDPILVDK